MGKGRREVVGGGGEMSRLNFVKKSIPRIGLATFANKNRCVNLV